MGSDEFKALLAGYHLKNDKKFSKNRTNSEGFCFLGEKTAISNMKIQKKVYFSPLACNSFLYGIVSNFVIVEFEVPKSSMALIKESHGIYADPFAKDFNAVICITEFNMPEYDDEILHPTKYCLGPYKARWKEADWIQYSYNKIA